MVSFDQPWQFLSITIFTLSLILPSLTGVDESYVTCKSTLFSCGNNISNVGYPFWGYGRPQYCGHPSLQLQCVHGDIGSKVQLIIGQERYAPYDVVNMKSNNLIVTLELQRSEEVPCTFNMTEFSEFFKLNSSDENITLVYNCPANINISLGYPNVSVPCSMDPTVNQAYYLHNMSAPKEYASCSSTEIPVNKKQLDLYNKGEIGALTQVLKQGFEVTYEYSSDCIKCNKWGGTCGSSGDSEFACFLPHKIGPFSVHFSPSIGALLLIICGGSGFLALGIVIICCLRKRRSATKFSIFWKSKAAKCPNVDAFLQIYGSLALTRHTHADIKKMTNGFKDKLGEGGYAIVYKGKLLNDRLVAVKVLKQSKGNGEDFLNEVASISRTNHVNIVSLLGFCFEGNKRALIYEYLPNGSLEKFTFHGSSASNQSLPRETLLNIALGIGRGLDYLHRGAVMLVFCTLTSSLTTFYWMMSSARLCPLRDSSISILETRGTIGYIAPEVFCRTIDGVSHKYDVYSFGMMVLDMVCGRNNLTADRQRSSELYFPQWIYNRLELEKEAPSERIGSSEEMAVQRKMILVSLWCIQTYPSNRPPMSQMVDMLLGCLESIEMPPNPNLSSPPRMIFDSTTTLTE